MNYHAYCATLRIYDVHHNLDVMSTYLQGWDQV